MKKFLAILSLGLLASCSGLGKTGSGVSYKPAANAVCPAPMGMDRAVSGQFEQYPEATLMKTFYRQFIRQQQQIVAFHQRQAGSVCPPAFWVENQVAEEFRNLPQGHPMREFFKSYVVQQRALDAYYVGHGGGGF